MKNFILGFEFQILKIFSSNHAFIFTFLILGGCTISGSRGGSIVEENSLLDSQSICINNSIITETCLTSNSNLAITNTFGSNITQFINNNSNNFLLSPIPSAFYSENPPQMISFTDPNLISENIPLGKSIFHVSGSAPVLISNLYRNKSTTQITQVDESIVYASHALPSGYREIPDIFKDDDGYLKSGESTNENIKAIRPKTECGVNQNTIAARILDCAIKNPITATWDGTLKGNAGQGVWKLVTLIEASNKEVWQDQRTQLLWSSTVAIDQNWCLAAGNGQNKGNGYSDKDKAFICNNSIYQPNYVNDATPFNVQSWCAESGVANMIPADPSEVWGSTPTYSDSKGRMGLNATSISPSVRWRLPSKYDFEQADINGIRFVFSDYLVFFSNDNPKNREWTSTIQGTSNNRSNSLFYNKLTGSIGYQRRSEPATVRCVGH